MDCLLVVIILGFNVSSALQIQTASWNYDYILLKKRYKNFFNKRAKD